MGGNLCRQACVFKVAQALSKENTGLFLGVLALLTDFESDRWPIRLPSVSVDTRSSAPSVCGENRSGLRPSASCVWPGVVRQTLSAAAWQRGGSRPPDAEGWRCSRVGADRVPVCRSRGFGGLWPLPLRRCGYRSRAVRRARLERRRDRHGLARARPSRWAGRGRARREVLVVLAE